MPAKLDTRSRSGHLAKTLPELLEAVQAQQRLYQSFVRTPKGWHVMWGMEGEFYGYDREKIEKLCREHTVATGMETVVISLTPGAQIATHFDPTALAVES